MVTAPKATKKKDVASVDMSKEFGDEPVDDCSDEESISMFSEDEMGVKSEDEYVLYSSDEEDYTHSLASFVHVKDVHMPDHAH